VCYIIPEREREIWLDRNIFFFYYIIFYPPCCVITSFHSQQDANWHTDVSVISFYNRYKLEPPTCFPRKRLLCCYFIDSLVNERTDVKRSHSHEPVYTFRSPAKWLRSLCWYFSYSGKYWAVSTTCAGKHEAFSLTARIVLKDDLRARAHEQLARLRLNMKRWKLSEASYYRLFIFKGQQLVIDNNCDVSSAYVVILCQFHRYVTVSRRGYWRSLIIF